MSSDSTPVPSEPDAAPSRRGVLGLVGGAVAALVLGNAGTAEAAVRRPAPRLPVARRGRRKAPARKVPAPRRPVARPVVPRPAAPEPRPAVGPSAASTPAPRPVGPAVPASGSAAVLPAGPNLLAPDPLLHLLRRTTWGLTPALVEEARRLGPQAWLDRQLDPDRIDDSACDAYLARYPTLGMTPAQVRAAAKQNGDWFSMMEVSRAALVRAGWSQRQLFEVMVDLWGNHLNVTCPSSEVWDSRADYDRTVIRPHALGRFADLLKASVRAPAMLRYLNNAESKGTKPNENHGRELLELHTVGIEAGYTEADVRASALALTGFTCNEPWWKGVTPESAGMGVYRSEWHYRGALQVLGWSHPNASADGQDAADSYLDYLARHPATARRIATKLCLRFVSDAPSDALVTLLAQTYLDADTAVVPVLRALFASEEFAASVGAKTRRPLEDALATVRVLGLPLPPGAVDVVYWQLTGLGHAPLGWHPPDGYPDVAAAWSSPAGTLGRWNLHLALASNWWAKDLGPADLTTLVGAPATVGELLDRLALSVLGQPLRPDDRDALLTFVGAHEGAPASSKGASAGLLPVLTALLLDSPVWSQR